MCVPAENVEWDVERIAARVSRFREVTKSPFGSKDQIGMLNLATENSVAAIMSRISGGRIYDLAVEYTLGMPSWTGAGDPPFQIWMSHTPSGTLVEDTMGVGDEQNRLVAYSGDCISMYTHTGTHVDAFSHFGYDGKVWNGFEESEHLGSRHWEVCGADQHPPVIARGVMIDVAASEGEEILPDSFPIGERELRAALKKQGTELQVGDVVMIRTGRMRIWPDFELYTAPEPGLTRDGAEFLAKAGAMMIGADNIALEQMPSSDPENWQVVHTYLLAEAGVPIVEVVNLEQLAANREYEFAFIGACLKIKGATGAPMRPLAMSVR